MGTVSSDSPLTSPVPLTSTPEDETCGDLHVYLNLHTSAGFYYLHRAVNFGVRRISICLLSTKDHISWTAREHREHVLRFPHWDLRALWDHKEVSDDAKFHVYLPDQSLVRFIKFPPATHSSEVLEWLHELVQLNTDALPVTLIRPRSVRTP